MTQARPPGRRQQQAAETQDLLLSAAREVFTERGYQAATVGLITSRAGSAHGTFYLYFKNKEDVFGQVIGAVASDLYDEAAADWRGATPGEAVRNGLEGFLTVFAEHRGLWRALIEASLQHASIERLWFELRRRFLDRAAALFAAAVADGSMRPLDPVATANALGAMTEWVAFTHFVFDEPPVTPSSPASTLDTLTDLWVHALYGNA